MSSPSSDGKTKTVGKALAVYGFALIVIITMIVPVCLVIALALSKTYDFLKGIL